MPDKTELEFQGAAEPRAAPQLMKACAICGVRFTGDARFCPYDGEPLRPLKTAEPKDPLLGALIDGRYEVQAQLGEGGMGVVYRVRHRVLERSFALKVLRADLAKDRELGLRFTREAQAAASVSNPNIVQINDFGMLPSGQPYFVMELISGEPLSALIRKGGPLPAARAVRMLVQIVEALGAAHQAGVIHRDLKPDNILICAAPSGEFVKVLDFGLAKVAGQSRLTKAGVVFGTPHYMSPEQAGGGTVDERTDIYALGVVMYEMFTGRVPFEADSYMGVLTKHLYVSPTPPSVLLGGIEELGALEQVTLRCLEKKPEKRYPAMSALLAELHRVATFNADGAFRVRPLEPGDANPIIRSLADELELPTEAELERALESAGLSKRKLSPAVVSAAAFLGVFLLLLTVYFATRTRTPAAPPAAPRDAPADTARSAATVPPPTVASPSALAAQPNVLPEVAAPSGDPTDRGSASPDPPKKRRTRAHPREPVSPGNSSTDKGKVLGDEVIDPWSR